MKINNRRYTGSKFKLMPWIKEQMDNDCLDCHSFCDIFGGTGVVTAECLDRYNSFIINDLLYSNNVIYKGFFAQEGFSKKKLYDIKEEYLALNPDNLEDNYVSINYGDKYFSKDDAKIIGFIRQDIEDKFESKEINEKEYYVLLSSLLYSFDRIANTVGHYEAFIKGKLIRSNFVFDLIEPFETDKEIAIYRKDSNELAREIKADIVFVDPPYNSRQYSRFYHVMEIIVKWDKPELFGVAMKPKEENMSDYCRNSAPVVFADLIENLNCKYIVVTYNNTYTSKSTSSQNKITLEQIEEILNNKGTTKIYSHEHHAFNAGKTELNDHKEFLFITEVKR